MTSPAPSWPTWPVEGRGEVSPYKLVVDRWLAHVCPPLGPNENGLEIGGRTHRGSWRPRPHDQWLILDVEKGPDVDVVADVRDLPPYLYAAFDVAVMIDVAHLLLTPWDAEQARLNGLTSVKSGGRFIRTQTYLRPGYHDADRAPMPTEGDVTPLGDLPLLLAQILYERLAWTRPLVSRFARHYRPRPINPNFPPFCLAWGVVETR